MKFNQGISYQSMASVWALPVALNVGGGTTNIGKALDVAAKNISLLTEGDRQSAPNKILLYTDGTDNDLAEHPPSLQEGINEIRAKNIDVFSKFGDLKIQRFICEGRVYVYIYIYIYIYMCVCVCVCVCVMCVIYIIFS